MRTQNERPIRIAIVGDFNRGKHSHWATEAALFHAAARLDLRIEPHWFGTPAIGRSGVHPLAEFDGIWGAPGSPFASMDGMLRAIEFAREHDVPYLGTCAGFQYALIEFTRNVLGVADADTAENDPDGPNIVITPVLCELPEQPGPRLAGTGVARPEPGSQLERLCGSADLRGEFFCSLEANAAYLERWHTGGLRVGARGAAGEMRALELPAKRFFLATLFQPQLSSSYQQPHPLVVGYLRACAA
jgi:CTP synthase (UTP-ammonia lyase)